MNERWNIVVMSGGSSAERAVSLDSGRAAAAALVSKGHRVTMLDPRPGAWRLPGNVEVVFLALHGTYGEDGTIQRELDALGVPYTSCGAEVSACAFDKVKSKRAFQSCGIPTPRFGVCNGGAWRGLPAALNFPLVLKPACQGSSVGVEFLQNGERWQEAVARTAAFGTVLAEEFIEGREVAVSILGRRVLPIVEIRPKSGRYDYHSKYTKGATEYFCPASLDAGLERAIRATAKRAFAAVGGGPCARVDMIVRRRELFVLEVNTIPGMTATSLLPKSARAGGVSYEELCHRLAALALEKQGMALTEC